MAIFPSNIGFSKADPLSESPAYLNEPDSLKTIATSTGAQRFGFELTTQQLKGALLRQGWAFLNARSGQAKPFDIVVPEFSQPLGVVSGAVKSGGAYGIGTRTVTLVNFDSEIGDFVRFAGHSKVYQVEDSQGQQATLYPPLIKPVSLAETAIVENVPFTVRLRSKVSKFSLVAKRTAQLKFTCFEAF